MNHDRDTQLSASVLVVEDETELRETLCELLADEGYRVRSAADGDEAIDHLREELPNVMVLDLVLPGITGWNILVLLREHDPAGRTRVVVTTSVPNQAPKGFPCLKKPVDVDELLTTVRSLCEDGVR